MRAKGITWICVGGLELFLDSQIKWKKREKTNKIQIAPSFLYYRLFFFFLSYFYGAFQQHAIDNEQKIFGQTSPFDRERWPYKIFGSDVDLFVQIIASPFFEYFHIYTENSDVLRSLNERKRRQ